MSPDGPSREAPGRRRSRDPQGKSALFASPPTHDRDAATAPGIPTGELGKRAWYSATDDAGRHRRGGSGGPFRVECERCAVVSRLGVLELLWCQFPVSYWFPFRGRFDRRMTCPSCHQRVWASVSIRRR